MGKFQGLAIILQSTWANVITQIMTHQCNLHNILLICYVQYVDTLIKESYIPYRCDKKDKYINLTIDIPISQALQDT